MTHRILTVAALLAATPAHAKSPGPPPERGVLTIVRPAHDEQAVPLDARIWLDEQSATDSLNYAVPREPRLFDPDGAALLLHDPLEISAPTSHLLVYTPPEPLRPNTTYTLRTCGDGECDHLLAIFTTADTTDRDPPALPQIDDLELLGERLDLTATFADDILVVGRDDGTNDDPLTRGHLVGAATREHPLDLTAADLGDSTSLRFAAYDLAGNFSGWTALREIERPLTPEAFSCRTAPAAPWYLLVPLLLLRRRR